MIAVEFLTHVHGHVARRSGLVVLAIVLVTPLSTAEGAKIYWTGLPGTVSRANDDGTMVETVVVDGLPCCGGIAVDSLHGKVYWAGENARMYSILRADLNGQNAEVFIPNMSAGGLAVDPLNGHLYWGGNDLITGILNGAILRAGLDGSGLTGVIRRDAGVSGFALAVDPAREMIYWTERTEADPLGWHVRRARYDGTNQELLAATTVAGAMGLALDPVGGKVYFGGGLGSGDPNRAGIIMRANLDGSDVETIVSELPDFDDYPSYLAIDAMGQHVFWSNRGRTWRARLDGSSVEQLPIGTKWLATDELIIPEPSGVLLLGSAIAIVTCAALRRFRESQHPRPL